MEPARLAFAYVAPAAAVAIALSRPRIGARRAGPGLAGLVGVALALAAGVVRPSQIGEAVATLWRPFVGVASIMATAVAAERLGLLGRVAHRIERATRGSVPRALVTVFLLSFATAALFNNDAAVLLLTPAVIELVRRRYPVRHKHLLVPFVFAVFVAAGVAPLPMSNPINLVVASYAGVRFNAYAARMIPVALAGTLPALGVLLLWYRRAVFDPAPAWGPEAEAPPPLTARERAATLVLGLQLLSYPAISALGGPVWAVSLVGAVALVGLATVGVPGRLGQIAAGVEWEILVFLLAVFVLADGLRNAGAVHGLAAVYGAAPPGAERAFLVGGGAAAMAALLNNHPTALLHAFALGQVPGAGRLEVLASLVGGDLGPRLLPVGSLAGLMWLGILRRHQVPLGLGAFVKLGLAITLPTLAVSLAVLVLVD